MSRQQFFSYVGTGLPGLNQYKARINVSCSRTQCSDAGEARVRCPSVSSQALYHCAPCTFLAIETTKRTIAGIRSGLSFEYVASSFLKLLVKCT